MQRCIIARVEAAASGRLRVAPTVAHEWYEYIYREANGLRWDRHTRALCASEPARWSVAELVKHLAAPCGRRLTRRFAFPSKQSGSMSPRKFAKPRESIACSLT